ncbi:F-box/kelch-repeat protein At3g23880-like [Chenopodium quinoa]|uniref:F-box domain-containing protein n=1 Tax=Chenopodium quinoa TaxID=63459 RepID=A0A803N198_CHEQI|nr:F-box/kelch-repeat protein At3g23880-like [Chenopodium quinoa]XP_021729254.1 F-box/kelch-repeat protein At3g23880-like [Chenopodium quinoa]
MEDEDSAMAEQFLKLPPDIIFYHILTKLPIKTLMQFKLVSKLWYSTLSSPQFALAFVQSSPSFHPSSPIQYLFMKNGDNHYLYSHDDAVEDEFSTNINKNIAKLGFDFGVDSDENLVLIGTCNGLVCLASESGSFFILWNPIIGKFRKYIDYDFVIDWSNPNRVSWGFGYVSNVDDYKVIRVTELGATLEIRVHVFSLKSNKWTRIADQLYQDIFSLQSMSDERFEFCSNGISRWFPYSFHLTRGVLVNETLYWIAAKINSHNVQIVSFDLGHEVFHNYMDLNLDPGHISEDYCLCVMGGCLSKYVDYMGGNGAAIHIFKWPGMVETILLDRDRSQDIDIVALSGFTRSGKFFILVGSATLGLVDPSSNPVKYIQLATLDRLGNSWIASYVPSLTLPYTTD